MTVADLQQYFENLGLLLKVSGANKQIMDDFAAIRAGLEPFRALPLKGFADFLLRAEAFSRGTVPIVPPKGGRKKKAAQRAGVAPPPDIKAIALEVRALYDHASEPNVSEEKIDAVLGRLGGLKIADLAAVAEAIELKGMTRKKKDEIIKAIRLRILTRKGATQKAGTVDRTPLRDMNADPQQDIGAPDATLM